MEVSRRFHTKHLQPARPLRRLNVDPESLTKVEPVGYAFAESKQMNGIGVEQFYEIVQSHTKQKPKKDRISYTRDFLIKLASSPSAKKRPDFLPDHPVVLAKVRDFDESLLLLSKPSWDQQY